MDFSRLPAWETATALAMAMVIASYASHRLGAKHRLAGKEPPTGKFGDATLALFGLLLAFTFSLSLTKHDQRRILVIAESNSIGDFYTCATLLKEPTRSKLQGVVRQYVRFLLDVAETRMQAPPTADSLRHVEELHGQMTTLVGEALDTGIPHAVPLTNTLNALTTSHGARLAAFRDHLPQSIVLLLLLASMVATALAGYEQGVEGKNQLIGTTGFILLTALTVYVTLDLNQPFSGFITVSKEPLQRLLGVMAPP